jgi:hypothetical protein
MLTLWVIGIQYFVVGLFDFHRARAPVDYWILDSFRPNAGLLIGASAQSVYNWEEGKARPRAQHLPAIA